MLHLWLVGCSLSLLSIFLTTSGEIRTALDSWSIEETPVKNSGNKIKLSLPKVTVEVISPAVTFPLVTEIPLLLVPRSF